MAIQILGKRPSVSNPEKWVEKFYSKNWRTETVQSMWINSEIFVSTILEVEEAEQHNLYFTASDCEEQPGKVFKFQSIIPFVIRNISQENEQTYIDIVTRSIGIEFTQTGIMLNGRDLYFIVGLSSLIMDNDYFKDNSFHYARICESINDDITNKGMPGEMDRSLFRKGALIPVPGITNTNGECKTIQRNIENVDFSINTASGVPVTTASDHIEVTELKRFPPPDTDYVLDQCNFIKSCAENPSTIKGENWYKMLSILARLENGLELCQDFSKIKQGYSEHDTARKVDEVLRTSGPRTCSNIGESFNCVTCQHYQKVRSPITLHGKDYIKTKGTGFRKIKIDNKGNVSEGPIDMEDLKKYFELENSYLSSTAGVVYTWSGTHWELMDSMFINAFVEKHVKPSPNSHDCNEFLAKLLRSNLVPIDFFEKSTAKRINLKNGILDFRTDEPILMKHSKEMGFMSTLPYDYTPGADCPIFDSFMEDVTLGRQELKDILLEFAGYSFANEECRHEKALILIGKGANGKSTFMETLKKLAGKDAFSAIQLPKLEAETHVARLHGKLFNMTEETPKKSFADSSAFKNIVSGGDISVRQLYGKPYEMKTNAKIVLACNELPSSEDITTGMTRRLLIVPFDADFEGANRNKNMKNEIGMELPGVLNRIIDGYLRLVANDGFTESAAVDSEVQSFVNQNDKVYEYFMEYINVTGKYERIKGKDYPDERVDEDIFLRVQEMYVKYKDEYCYNTGVRTPLVRKAFLNQMLRHIPDMNLRKDRKSLGIVLTGIGFKER